MQSQIEMEYRLKVGSDERLRNEHILIVEEKEMELRKDVASKEKDYKIAKLEHRVQLI